MHEIIRRYAGKTSLVNGPMLFLYRRTPHWARRLAVYGLGRVAAARVPEKKFLIFAQGRSGSTFMVDLMNSHPDILSLGEIMQHNVISGLGKPREYAEGLSALSKKPVCGFKVKIYQLERVQKRPPNEVLREFQDNGWKLIYLYRRNLVKHSLSDIRSELTGNFHNIKGATGNKVSQKDSNGKGGKQKIHIDPDELMKVIRFRESCRERELAALEGLDYLELQYERDLSDESARDDAMNRVWDYLEIPRCKTESAFRKVSSRKLADGVSNAEEVEARLQAEGYADYLTWG